MSYIGSIIICGAPRAGSTSLFRFLCEYEEVACSDKKEMNFFLGGNAEMDTYSKKSPSDYISMFPETLAPAWTLEASPAYMRPDFARRVAQRIRQSVSNPKLVFVLREPVDRLRSHVFVEGVRGEDGQLKSRDCRKVSALIESLEGTPDSYIHEVSRSDDLTRVTLGLYADTLGIYLEYFDPSEIHIVFLENFSDDPGQEIGVIESFVGLKASVTVARELGKENPGVGLRFPAVYRALSGPYAYLEPLFLRFPALRRGLRHVHGVLNVSKETVTNELDRETLALARSVYPNGNLRLLELLSTCWPEKKLPDWLKRNLEDGIESSAS